MTSKNTSNCFPFSADNDGMTLDRAIESFIIYLRSLNRRPRTIAYYTWFLKKFKQFMDETGLLLKDEFIDHRDLQVFILTAFETISDRTYNDFTRTIKTFFKFCQQDLEIFKTNPALKLKYRSVDEHFEPALTKEEVLLILENCPAKDFYSARRRTIILFMLDNGTRLGELAHIKVEDIQDRLIRIESTHSKSRRIRQVPYGYQVSKAIHNWIYKFRNKHTDAKSCPYLFCSKNGKPLNLRSFEREIQNLGHKISPVFRLHPHRFRVTFATLYKGHPNLLQTIGGWKDQRMVSRYVRLSGKDLAEAHLEFSPADQLTK